MSVTSPTAQNWALRPVEGRARHALWAVTAALLLAAVVALALFAPRLAPGGWQDAVEVSTDLTPGGTEVVPVG